MDVSPKIQNKQVTINRPQEAQEKGGMKWGCLGSSEKGNKILTGAIKEKKYGEETEVKASQSNLYSKFQKQSWIKPCLKEVKIEKAINKQTNKQTRYSYVLIDTWYILFVEPSMCSKFQKVA